jgi:hypothetical protein
MLRPFVLTLALCLLGSAAAVAQDPPTPPPDDPDTAELFGFRMPQTTRLQIDADVAAGWSHDGAQAQLGFEKQGRLAWATLILRGRLNDHVSYKVSINPVSETSSKPSCGETNFFYPNTPELYAAGPVIVCDPEDGTKRVDTYNTYSLDYIVQQGPLREGYVDFRFGGAYGSNVRFGRFILPIGFAPDEVGSWTAKDMTRIQRLNAEANFGGMYSFGSRNAAGLPVFELAAIGVLGDGNREKDYDWFYFMNTSLDANSALTAAVSARVHPNRFLDVRGVYKKGFTGSKVERLPSYWASKRHDDAVVGSVKVTPVAWASVFGEYARYTWGPTETSAELVGVDTAPIDKAGYYVGLQLAAPVHQRVRIGATVTREELSRDDSMVKYLEAAGLYGVEMGRKDRGLVVRGFVELWNRLTIGGFWADVSNPYPWVSASWPVGGPAAFTGRSQDRYGFTIRVQSRP